MADAAPPPEITLDEIRRLADAKSPDLAAVIRTYLEQPDPAPAKTPPQGTMTQADFDKELRRARNKRGRNNRRTKAKEAWHQFLNQPDLPPPPRFQLAELLVGWYESGSQPAREAILALAKDASLRWGLWGGLKRIYKLAEARLDAEMLGVLAVRFSTGRNAKGEVSGGTLTYLRKRARRFYGTIARTVPEIYPQFVVAACRHMDASVSPWQLGVLYNDRVDDKYVPAPAPAWAKSPAPLLQILEEAQNNEVAGWAIQSLRTVFPDVVRASDPQWLARLARRPLASVHEFFVQTLQGSPELHQGKLKALGLHQAVVDLIPSPSETARKYAIEYARAHATDLPAEWLVELAEGTKFADAKAFASELLATREPRQLGARLLARMLPSVGWAGEKLAASFDRTEISDEILVDLILGANVQRAWVEKWLAAKYQPGELAPDVWKRALADARLAQNYQASSLVQRELGKYTAEALGADWLLENLVRPGAPSTIAANALRRAERLPGLDVEKVKGLVFSPQQRPLALAILGNTKIVRPKDLGLGWLLALARRPDPSLHEFAHRYLLEYMTPADFGGGERIFELAAGEKSPEPVRTFAQTYLRCHHPVLGPNEPDTKAFQLKPQVAREEYQAERIWPLLADVRADVRRFAVAIARTELRRWGRFDRVYELTDSIYKEVRQVAYQAMLDAGKPGADASSTMAPDELSPAGVFAMTESRVRETREVGVELVRKHYARLGGVGRLAWLMESADRTVRLLAVRLLWEKHRPRRLPEGWKPKLGDAPEEAGRFNDVDAMRGFLRTILFGLPPGRESEPGEAVTRRLSAGEAKRNLVEVIRDLGVEDGAFARVAAPVFLEFTGAYAKGEWQACLSALMTLRHAHPEIALA